MVAFHFHLSKQAGWKCEECRRSGLEKKRRCGWMGIEISGRAQVVWVHGDHSLTRCPRSYITAESMGLLDAYSAWKLAGGTLGELPAKQVDAFAALEREMRREMSGRTDGSACGTAAESRRCTLKRAPRCHQG